ncbi:RTA-like protein [Penicillium expansum]|nr:RTA-like protein [Penicillium expansum]
MNPKLFTWIFIGSDIGSIVLQAAGGGVANAAGTDQAMVEKGNNITIAGIVFQVATMSECGVMALEFFIASRKNLREGFQGEAGTEKLQQRICLVLAAEIVAYTTVLIRCIYQFPEMAGGWGNDLMQNQMEFLASGNLGPTVLSELLDAGLTVTVLTRQNSNKTFDPRAQVEKVDYESLESLKAALAGNEVVVNTLGRFLPSEYGSDTTYPNAAKLQIFADKIAVQEHLKEVSQQSGLGYSILINGPFLDWGLKIGGVGKAVVGIVNDLSATKNSIVFVNEATVSQKELLALSGKHVETKSVQTSEIEQEAFAELGKPAPNPGVFVFGFLRRAIFGEGLGSLFDSKKLSNDLFGKKILSKEDLQGLFA